MTLSLTSINAVNITSSIYKWLWGGNDRLQSTIAGFHTLQFTVTSTSFLSLLQSQLSVSWQQILTQDL
jgi:hypothetical protein